MLRAAWEFLDFGLGVARGLVAKNGVGGVSAVAGGFSVLNDYEGLEVLSSTLSPQSVAVECSRSTDDM